MRGGKEPPVPEPEPEPEPEPDPEPEPEPDPEPERTSAYANFPSSDHLHTLLQGFAFAPES